MVSCLDSQGALLQSVDSSLVTEPGKRAKVLEVKGSTMLGGNKTILILPSGERNFNNLTTVLTANEKFRCKALKVHL